MNKYEIRTQKKKDAIIQASLALFKEKGYTNTGIVEIAAAAHVSAVSIYNYFGSKEGLVRECAGLLLRETCDMIAALLAEPGSFKDKLLQAVAMCTEKPHELLEEYFSQDALDDKEFVELFNESVNEIRLNVLADFVESGKEEGAIAPSLSTDTILEFLKAAAPVQAEWNSQQKHKEASGELYQLILYGLIGR